MASLLHPLSAASPLSPLSPSRARSSIGGAGGSASAAAAATAHEDAALADPLAGTGGGVVGSDEYYEPWEEPVSLRHRSSSVCVSAKDKVPGTNASISLTPQQMRDQALAQAELQRVMAAVQQELAWQPPPVLPPTALYRLQIASVLARWMSSSYADDWTPAMVRVFSAFLSVCAPDDAVTHFLAANLVRVRKFIDVSHLQFQTATTCALDALAAAGAAGLIPMSEATKPLDPCWSLSSAVGLLPQVSALPTTFVPHVQPNLLPVPATAYPAFPFTPHTPLDFACHILDVVSRLAQETIFPLGLFHQYPPSYLPSPYQGMPPIPLPPFATQLGPRPEPPPPSFVALEALESCDLTRLQPAQVADQLTYLSFRAFSCIPPDDLVAKRDKVSPRNKVTSMVHHFNQTSYWIAAEILMRESVKMRTKALDFFISVAEHCMYRLGNFHSAFAIAAATSLQPVFRLRGLKMELSVSVETRLKQLQDACSSSDNFSRYRPMLEAAFNEQRPAVPFMGVFLKDMALLLVRCTTQQR